MFVYNYIQIVRKYLLNQVRRLQLKWFAANAEATHEKF